jgi:hypothetical protein
LQADIIALDGDPLKDINRSSTRRVRDEGGKVLQKYFPHRPSGTR